MQITKVLTFEEGFSEEAYYCSRGYPTIGYGTKLGPKDAPIDYYRFTVTKEIAAAMMNADLSNIVVKLVKLDWYNQLNDDRKSIIVSMAYQLGVAGLLKFKRMIAAIEDCNFEQAAWEALDSQWYVQTPERAKRHAAVIESGKLTSVAEYCG